MNFEEIIDLFEKLDKAVASNQIEWVSTGNTRYRTYWNCDEIIIDRRNNTDKNSMEICLKIRNFESTYNPHSKEFNFLSEQIEKI